MVGLENFYFFGTAWAKGHVRSALRRAWLEIWANGSRHCVHLAELCKFGFCFAWFGRQMTLEFAPKIQLFPFSDCCTFSSNSCASLLFFCVAHFNHYWGVGLRPWLAVGSLGFVPGTSEASFSLLFLLSHLLIVSNPPFLLEFWSNVGAGLIPRSVSEKPFPSLFLWWLQVMKSHPWIALFSSNVGALLDV